MLYHDPNKAKLSILVRRVLYPNYVVASTSTSNRPIFPLHSLMAVSVLSWRNANISLFLSSASYILDRNKTQRSNPENKPIVS